MLMVDTIDLTIIWHITVLTTLLCTQHYIFLRLEHQMQQQQQKAQMSTTTTRRVTAMMIMIPRASTEEGGRGGREGGRGGEKERRRVRRVKRRGKGREVVMSSLLCPTIKWFWHEHSKKEPETIVCQQLHGNTECSKFGNEKTVQMREASCAGNSFYG